MRSCCAARWWCAILRDVPAFVFPPPQELSALAAELRESHASASATHDAALEAALVAREAEWGWHEASKGAMLAATDMAEAPARPHCQNAWLQPRLSLRPALRGGRYEALEPLVLTRRRRRRPRRRWSCGGASRGSGGWGGCGLPCSWRRGRGTRTPPRAEGAPVSPLSGASGARLLRAQDPLQHGLKTCAGDRPRLARALQGVLRRRITGALHAWGAALAAAKRRAALGERAARRPRGALAARALARWAASRERTLWQRGILRRGGAPCPRSPLSASRVVALGATA